MAQPATMNPRALRKRNTSFRSDVVRLVSGTALAQVIGLAAAPILTRLYTPEAFGVAAMFASITAILGVLACMRYELSIILPDNDREAANLLAVSLVITGLTATLTIPLVLYAGEPVVNWLNMPELAPYLWLVPLTVLIYGIFSPLSYWNTRTKHFARLSIARVTSQLAGTSSSLAVGFAGHATGGTLIATSVGGQAVATIVLGGQIWRDNGRFILSCITLSEMWEGVRRHWKFPIYSSWGALINTASWHVPVLMLGVFFSSAVVGFYSLGFRLIQMPMNLIGSAIGQVLYQHGAEARNRGELGLTVDAIFKRMLIIGLLPSLILTIIGEDLFSAIFGIYWSEAGLYVQILAPWALVWFISSPLSAVYFILEKQREELVVHMAILGSRIAALTVGGLLDSPRIAILLFSLGGILAYGYVLQRVFFYSGIVALSQVKVLFRNLINSSLYLIPLVLAKYLNIFEDIGLLILVLPIILFYYYQHRFVLFRDDQKQR